MIVIAKLQSLATATQLYLDSRATQRDGKERGGSREEKSEKIETGIENLRTYPAVRSALPTLKVTAI